MMTTTPSVENNCQRFCLEGWLATFRSSNFYFYLRAGVFSPVVEPISLAGRSLIKELLFLLFWGKFLKIGLAFPPNV
jgi:hypothetical protein